MHSITSASGILWAGVLLATLALPPVSVSAGTEIAATTRGLEDGQEKVRSGVAYLDGARVRIDIGSGRRSLVYHSDRGVVYVLDHKKQSYIEFHPPRVAEIQKELDRRLEGLPPEARGVVDQLLGTSSGSVESDVSVRETGSIEEVLEIPCTGYEVVEGEDRVADVCQATYADAKVDPASFAALQEIQQQLQGVLGGMVPGSLKEEGITALRSFGTLEGLPLRVRTYTEGSLDSETNVTRLEQKDLSASLFELPDGYRPSLTIDVRDYIGGP